jgi:DNA-binding response OmpR family regulator
MSREASIEVQQWAKPQERCCLKSGDWKCTFIRRILLEGRGYRVLTATSGARGLALLQQNTVDAVILDYRMEGMDGAAVATMIRPKTVIRCTASCWKYV